jgi:hypothetical protein
MDEKREKEKSQSLQGDGKRQALRAELGQPTAGRSRSHEYLLLWKKMQWLPGRTRPTTAVSIVLYGSKLDTNPEIDATHFLGTI